MVNKFKAELTKISAQLNRFLARTGNKQWPANVLDMLETKYHLLPKDLLRLWYIRHRIITSKFNAYSIFIYDWVKAYDLNVSIKEYNDLYKYPDLLLYKGYIFSSGEVSIEEIRKN